MRYPHFIKLFKILFLSVVLANCGSERTVLFVESPDGTYTLKVTHTLGPANSTALMSVEIARGKKYQAKKFRKVFEGRASARPHVYWGDSDLVRIDYCRGYIMEISSPFYDRVAKKEIYVQVVNTPGLFVNGEQACPDL